MNEKQKRALTIGAIYLVGFIMIMVMVAMGVGK